MHERLARLSVMHSTCSIVVKHVTIRRTKYINYILEAAPVSDIENSSEALASTPEPKGRHRRLLTPAVSTLAASERAGAYTVERVWGLVLGSGAFRPGGSGGRADWATGAAKRADWATGAVGRADWATRAARN
eukprot:103329-Prorocentrum_minimum.AAC.1